MSIISLNETGNVWNHKNWLRPDLVWQLWSNVAVAGFETSKYGTALHYVLQPILVFFASNGVMYKLLEVEFEVRVKFLCLF